MQLVVAEKPSVARDLARVLGAKHSGRGHYEGDGRVITWCVGHLVELDEPASYDPRWKAWSLDTLPMLPSAFKLRPAKHGGDQLRELVALLRDRRFESVVNACDAGREGELIFRYVYQHAGCRLPILRLWISSLTDDAIRRGFTQIRPGKEFEALGDAARARAEADWLVGMNATRAVTVRHRGAGQSTLYSIGRVQTPTLAILVAREKAIHDFVPQAYWEVRARLSTTTAGGAKEGFPALWTHGKTTRIAQSTVADAIVERAGVHGRAIDKIGPRVESVRARTVREAPPLLFDLTSLQRTANKRFGMSAQHTLDVAQSLYERHKVLTYPRTDARHLTTDVAKELPKLFAALRSVPDYASFAARLLASPPKLTKRVVDDAKVHDHHAIIPTGKALRAGELDRDEQRVFDLVVRRFLGVFFADAEFAVTEAVIRVGALGGTPVVAAGTGERRTPLSDDADESDTPIVAELPPAPDRFVARGRVRVAAGWQDVAGIEDGGDEDKNSRRGRDEAEPLGILPPLVVGQALDGAFESMAKRTQPPRRYTEATLLSAMETAGKALDDEELRAAMKDTGLGTPATRAATIETLLKRGYAVRDKKLIVATAMGISLIGVLPVESLASPELTGSWEARLARIARGQETRAQFMSDIALYVRTTVDAIRASSSRVLAHAPAAPEPARSRPKQGTTRTLGTEMRTRRGAAKPRRGSTAPRASTPSPRGRANSGSAVWGTKTQSPMAKSSAVGSKSSGNDRPSAIVVGDLPCPRCKIGRLVEGRRGWGCGRWRNGCSYVVWFETCGRRVTDSQLRDLVTTGRTRKSQWCPAGSRAPIAGRLKLDVNADGGARFEPA